MQFLQLQSAFIPKVVDHWSLWVSGYLLIDWSIDYRPRQNHQRPAMAVCRDIVAQGQRRLRSHRQATQPHRSLAQVSLCTAQPLSFNDIVKSCSVYLFHNVRKSNHRLHELLSSCAQRFVYVYTCKSVKSFPSHKANRAALVSVL